MTRGPVLPGARPSSKPKPPKPRPQPWRRPRRASSGSGGSRRRPVEEENPWENPEENHRKMGKPWENHRKTIGLPSGKRWHIYGRAPFVHRSIVANQLPLGRFSIYFCQITREYLATSLPSGKLTGCYWKWPWKVRGFYNQEWCFFSIVMLVYLLEGTVLRCHQL